MASSAAARVRERIAGFGVDVMFTTLEVLGCGNRNSVDIELCRLVAKGVIERLAAGVFKRKKQGSRLPPVIEIAVVKANRFGKKAVPVQTSPQTAGEKQNVSVFYTDGCSGRFESLHGPVRFKHATPRKIRAGLLANQGLRQGRNQEESFELLGDFKQFVAACPGANLPGFLLDLARAANEGDSRITFAIRDLKSRKIMQSLAYLA